MDTAVPSRSASTPMILGVIGGFVLAIGSFLNWATVSVNFDKIATALGLDPSQIPDSVRQQSTASATGWKLGDGKWTFAAGIVVLVFAALLMTARNGRLFGILMIVGGVVGAGIAAYDAATAKDKVLNSASSALSGVQLPGQLKDYLSISLGIGIWLCMIGGVVAIVGGIMAMIRGDVAPAMEVGTAGAMAADDGGFGTSSVAGSMAPPPPAPVSDPVAPMTEAPPATPTESPAPMEPPAPVAEAPAPPVVTPPVETPPVETPPVETPPVETPAVETPAVETPAAPVEAPSDPVPGGGDEESSSP